MGDPAIVQKNETELLTPLLLQGERECDPQPGLVFANCAVVNDGDPENVTNEKNVFNSGFPDTHSPDQYVGSIGTVTQHEAGIYKEKEVSWL
jgi:hypothetical protein